MDLQKAQYILFDWDNTLADTHDALVNTVDQVLKEYNLPDWEETAKSLDRKLSFKDNFSNFFGIENAEAAYERYNQIYLTSTLKTVKALPGAAEIISFLHQQGKILIIVSNKVRNLVEAEVENLFAPHLFAKMVCRCEAPRDKPHPEPVYFALENWLTPAEINPETVWFVGDSQFDSDCAIAAHALPIRVGTQIWKDCPEPLDPKIIYYKDLFALLAALKLGKI